MSIKLVPLAVALLATPVLLAQRPAAELATPPASTFHDSRSGITFQVPAGWSLTRKDGEVSTYARDVHSTLKSSQVRAVVNIAFNPYPQSTFSGAYLYLNYAPHSIQADCDRQTAALKPGHPISTKQIGGVTFSHGYDDHGSVCIESRNEIYTAMHNNACYRFDLVIHNFCGEVSGVRDISQKELDNVRQRLESILNSVQFDTK
jgi:hypothetical protein